MCIMNKIRHEFLKFLHQKCSSNFHKLFKVSSHVYIKRFYYKEWNRFDYGGQQVSRSEAGKLETHSVVLVRMLADSRPRRNCFSLRWQAEGVHHSQEGVFRSSADGMRPVHMQAHPFTQSTHVKGNFLAPYPTQKGRINHIS